MPWVEINGERRKLACEQCIRGHRSSRCDHEDRVLVDVRKPGRPLTSCPHLPGTACSCERLTFNPSEHGSSSREREPTARARRPSTSRGGSVVKPSKEGAASSSLNRRSRGRRQSSSTQSGQRAAPTLESVSQPGANYHGGQDVNTLAAQGGQFPASAAMSPIYRNYPSISQPSGSYGQPLSMNPNVFFDSASMLSQGGAMYSGNEPSGFVYDLGLEATSQDFTLASGHNLNATSPGFHEMPQQLEQDVWKEPQFAQGSAGQEDYMASVDDPPLDSHSSEGHEAGLGHYGQQR